ncbi:MAG: large-conductance mechanosensitive channel protein MscL [Clostridia bacterium]|nr:large-conductance mechanosensitive channel protein MscL [Clostridia bacterium]
MKGFVSDFKAFIAKGNVLDMAVGVVIGGAFGKIISSLVADVITPLIGLLTGNVSLTDLKWVISPAELNEAGEIVKNELALTYGNFIQAIIDFLLIALSIFIVLRIIMKSKKKLEEKRKKDEPAPEEPKEEEPKETELSVLCEIREMLKKDKNIEQ